MNVTIILRSLCLLLICVIKLVRGNEPTYQPKCHTIGDRFIMEENKPFQIVCVVNSSVALVGNFSWNLDVPPDTVRIPVQNGDIYEIETTLSEDKKTMTSMLTVKKPLTEHRNSVWYYGRYTISPGNFQEENAVIRVFKEETVPVPKVSNTTDNITETTARFGDKVKLSCQVKYNNKNPNTLKYKYKLSWRKATSDNDLDQKEFPYLPDENMEKLDVSVPIRHSFDGGDYVCHMSFKEGKVGGKDGIEALYRNASITLKIHPQINGPSEKEVKEVAGDDATLHCDIVGYPITYEWLYEDRKKIDASKDSRITINKNVLYIDNIDYDDRKKFICVGKLGDDELEQVIILRVKDRLAPLWPFIGIIVEAVLIIAIISGCHYHKSTTTSKTDGASNAAVVDPAASSTNT